MQRKRPSPPPSLRVAADPFAPAVIGPGGKTVIRVASPPAVARMKGQKARLFVSWYRFSGKSGPARVPREVLWFREEPDGGGFEAALDARDFQVHARARVLTPRSCQISYEVRDVADLRIEVRLGIEPGERFFGFGERFNGCDQRGRCVDVWAEERSVAWPAALARLFPGARRNPFPSGPDSTYCPIPFFLSSRGWGLLVEESNRVLFDVGKSDPNELGVAIFGSRLTLTFFIADSPLGVIEEMTARTGRATVPAPWVFAPWNDAVTGPAKVREVAETLRRERIPSSAIWTEDWSNGKDGPFGSYVILPTKMTVDRKRYADIEGLSRDLKTSGFRFLGYFFPYVYEKTEDFSEGIRRGAFLRDRKGEPLLLNLLGARYGQIDFTSPEARDFIHRIFERTVALGFDGWMTDFGEYVPVEARLRDGSSGWEAHNRYPLLWQEATRAFFDRARPDGDFVFFVRSGAAGTQRYAPVLWSGDQSTSFDRLDGLPAVVPAMLNAGISGIPFVATDIAGYKSFTCPASDRELFIRWTQLASCLPVMRTHHGVHVYRNWSFDRDRETIDEYRRYARLHTALFPHLLRYAAEAARSGAPIVRHLHLHYPGDPIAGGVDDEFLLGEGLLVAPVLERGAAERTVYLPAGEWADLWTGERHRGPARVRVSAPLDRLPLFLAVGAILPTLDRYCDTLDPKPIEGLKTLHEADRSLRITVAGPGVGEIDLADGTRIAVRLDGPLLAEGDSAVSVHEGEPGGEEPDEMVPFLWKGTRFLAAAEGKRVRIEIRRAGRVAGEMSASGPAARRYAFHAR